MPTSPASKHGDKPWALISLPPFPAVAMRVVQMLSREDMSLKELSAEIQSDPALSSELLTLANSPLFAFRTEIRTVLQASALLGAQRVKALALTVGMRTYLMQSFQIPALLACWRHSLACALLAEELAVASMMEKDFAYLAGLLHDIGRLALGMIKPIEYANLLASAGKGALAVLEGERALFDIDHCQAGRWLTESWKLPNAFAEIAAHHHDKPRGKFDIVALVHHSCRMADALGFEAAQSPQPPSFEEVLECLPDHERSRFSPKPKDLATRIAIKIQSVE